MDILVADDDSMQRRLLEVMLTQNGFQVKTVADGISAWEILNSPTHPDLAILDWMMPGLDGIDICRKIRETTSERYVYLLLLSARADRSDVLQGLEAGADDYLTKPCDSAELLARLNTGRRIVQLQNNLIAAREAMRRQATRDGLTGAWNHSAILEILDRELARAHRETKSVVVALVDVDHFKRVNDSFGHPAGDTVLREVVSRMTATLRPADIIGRYGGEEFLLILPGCDLDSGRSVCERLHARIRHEPYHHDGQVIPVTASFGAAVASGPISAAALVRAADLALYRAKANGRDRIEMTTT